MSGNDLIMGGGQSFAFDNIGDGFTSALVTNISDEQQALDLDTGEPRYWDPGKTRPVLQTVVTMTLAQHDRSDANDDGQRLLFVQAGSNRQRAIAAAVRATGGQSFDVGCLLSMRYTGDGEKKNKGKNAPKLYEAAYVPPQSSGAAGIMGQQPAQAQPVQQQPTPVQQWQQNPGQFQGQQQYAQGGPVQPGSWPQQPPQGQQAPQQSAPAQPVPMATVTPYQAPQLDMTGLPPEVQQLILMQQQQQNPQQ